MLDLFYSGVINIELFLFTQVPSGLDFFTLTCILFENRISHKTQSVNFNRQVVYLLR